MPRLLDLFAVLIVAAVLLLPRPSVRAFPAAQGDLADLDRLSVLQDALYRQPDDVGTAVELARAYLAVGQPAWALSTLAPFRDRRDHRVHQVAAFAEATVVTSSATPLRPADALREAELGLAACDAEGPRCPAADRIRISYLAGIMRKMAEAGVDPRKDPLAAKRLVAEALHASKAPAEMPAPAPPRAPPATPKAPPATP